MLLKLVKTDQIRNKPETTISAKIRCSIRINSHLFCRGFMFYLCYFYFFIILVSNMISIIRWCSCRLTVTRWVSHVEQEWLTLPEHLSSPPGFSGIRVTQSLVFYVIFVDRCLSFCSFSFGHCVCRCFFLFVLCFTNFVFCF